MKIRFSPQLAARLEHVVEAADVDGPGLLGVLLPGRRQEGGQVIDDADPVPAEDRGEPGPVGDVEQGERAGFRGRARGQRRYP